MQNQSATEMDSLSTCVNKLVKDGYSINFKVDEQGLVAVEEGKHFKPDQVHIKNFFRFEGASDPGDLDAIPGGRRRDDRHHVCAPRHDA